MVGSKPGCGSMGGLTRLVSARTISAGHAFVQNLRRGHDAITLDLPMPDRVRVASDELSWLCPSDRRSRLPAIPPGTRCLRPTQRRRRAASAEHDPSRIYPATNPPEIIYRRRRILERRKPGPNGTDRA
jgi:hypothetical protein